MAQLEIKNLKISFKVDDYVLPALFGINLTLEKGKTLGLVGESGCGKSITAMSVLRLLPKNTIINSGEIIFNGKDILKMTEAELLNIRGKKIAFIPQDPMTSLNPLMTIGAQVQEVVELHRKVNKQKAKEIVIDALKSVKIPDAAEKYNAYPHQLSGGMRQRVIIAMALSCESELIIADEPTTALDVTVQAQILGLIKEIQRKNNISLLLITHDLGVVFNVCDETAVMYAGEIVEKATTSTLFKSPKHPYTKALLSTMPTLNKERVLIKGQPPALTEIIQGCRFNPRCNFKTDICKSEIPQEQFIADSMVKCFNCNL